MNLKQIRGCYSPYNAARQANVFFKNTLCAFILLFPLLQARAQYVSLNSNEVKFLKAAIENDQTASTYKKEYNAYFDAAQQALTETPNPIEKITSQGLLEGNPAKTASLKAVEDTYKTYALALVYRISGDKTYLNKAAEFLVAWGKTNKATGGPIDETKLEDMITAYDLVRDKVKPEDKAIIDQWFDSIANAEVNSASAKGNRGTAINNWNSHRIKIITLIAYTLHDEKYNSIITTEMEKQLAVNLNPDGTTHDFVERDAFHYHTYDLEPLLTASIAIYRATGKNYFTYQTPNGASIKKCVDFMVPYMTGEKTHGEFVNSTVSFDQKRAQNNEKGYAAGTPFIPKSGLFTVSLAQFFDPSYLAVMQQVSKQGQQYFTWQLALNNAKNADKR